MTHLSMEQLLALREPASEPGQLALREHVASCSTCSAEFDRLHQRTARLKALPVLRPARDMWAPVALRRRAEARARRLRRGALMGLAAAASIAAVVLVGPHVLPSHTNDGGVTAAAIQEAQAQSATLEQVLDAYNPNGRVINGRTAGVAQVLEDRIAQVDQRLQAAEMAPDPLMQDQERLDLWRQRVGLMDALVDVHVTRASSVGF
ncbi:MAG TPA: hypothetical protein VFM12_03310 [Gemmatimonadales bacterium]|jgi:hypothetical protein|nr:hypothetical protein [Gemmatimonadales bacterium]